MGYLAQGLVSLGHRVGIVTLSEKEGFNSGGNKNIRHYRLGGRNNYDPRLLWKLYRLIRRFRPDIVQTWNPQTDILGGIAAVLNACLWVIREPNCADSYRSGCKSKLRARMGAKADAVVSNSTGGADYWQTLYPAKRNYVISNGLPLTEIARTQPISRYELGIEEDQTFVFFAGRLRRQKGVDRIITALSMLDPELKTVVFICGEGEQRDELQTQARELGVEDRVRFLGRLPAEAIWAMMKSADLFVSLSDYEGMPNTVMEAMACGCPLLVSDIPAHREIIDEKNASLVDPNDKKEIENVLSSLLSSHAVKATLTRAQAAKEKVRSWSVTDMVNRYEKVYREMITNRIHE